ncbi:chitinase [Streptomyces sp. NPDC050523]|uniref:chitinase n=1 Tax=Streptomyces sp. NPDC050523 TaxID=3365622 RepID=UPI0037B8602E
MRREGRAATAPRRRGVSAVPRLRATGALLTAALLAAVGGTLTTTTTASAAATTGSAFVVSKAQYDEMFPRKKPFYNYEGLVTAMKKYPAFAGQGGVGTRKREAAAFLANVSHETGGLVYIVEQNKANWPYYCDTTQPYGCPAGQSAYYGRGPMQLSWNFNYKAAGDALGIDLLHKPELVQQKPDVAWKTALWFWMTQSGAGTVTPHSAIVTGSGFGQTIRSINGAIECNGGNPAEVQDRVALYKRFTKALRVSPGRSLSC